MHYPGRQLIFHVIFGRGYLREHCFWIGSTSTDINAKKKTTPAHKLSGTTSLVSMGTAVCEFSGSSLLSAAGTTEMDYCIKPLRIVYIFRWTTAS